MDQKFFVFDVETWGLNATPSAFALGCIYGKNYSFRSSNLEEFRNELLSSKFSGAIIFAHNALFDLSAVFGNILTDLDNKTIFNGSLFILAKHNKTTFADSLNILPTKVEKIGELLGFAKGITPEKFKNAEKQKLTDEDFDYCMRDCKIVYQALENIFNKIGCKRVTLASLSMAYFRRNFLKKPLFYTERVYEFFDTYYGGRVECFKMGKVYAQKFDINSMYPFAMKYAHFPDPGKLRDIDASDDNFQAILDNYEGYADLTVEHKDTYFGHLPYRDKEKLIFPIGTFRGKWNLNEIRYAYERNVITIKEYHKVVIAPRKETIFAEFVTQLYNERKASKNEFEKYLLKIILNSLYGKFAQKKAYSTEYVGHLSEKDISPNKTIVPFNSERDDAYIVTENPYYSYNSIPVFSSYITSFARVHLLKQLNEFEENEIVYCDTDSIAVNNYTKEIPTGDNLGEFKLEPKIIVNVIGNKSYEELDGNIVLKGVPKKAIKKNGKYKYTSMVKPKTALRRNIQAGTFIEITKEIKAKYDKRKVLSDGTTKPIKLPERNSNLLFTIFADDKI